MQKRLCIEAYVVETFSQLRSINSKQDGRFRRLTNRVVEVRIIDFNSC